MKIRVKKEQPVKKHIQEIAAKLFAKEGYDGVSVMDICNEAGVNNSMISYYFGGKMGLYESIANRMIDKQIEYISNLIKIEDFKQLSIDRKIEEFDTVLDQFIDFFYNEVSTDMIMLMLREQQDPRNGSSQNFLERAPLIVYLQELLADITVLPPEITSLPGTRKNLIFHIMSVIAIMSSPRIFSTLLCSLLGDDNKKLSAEDIDMVRENLKLYVSAMFGRSQKVVPNVWSI